MDGPYSPQGSEQQSRAEQASFFPISEWAATAAPASRTRRKRIVFQGFLLPGGPGTGVPQHGL